MSEYDWLIFLLLILSVILLHGLAGEERDDDDEIS